MKRVATLVLTVLMFCAHPAKSDERFVPVGRLWSDSSDKATVPANSLECPTEKIPTLSSIQTKQFRSFTSVMSASRAAKLSINFYGSATGSFQSSDLVVVADTRRGDTCLARDGKTTLLYGQTTRVTVLLKQLQVDGQVNFAVVAANATMTGKSNFVEVDSFGVPAEVQQELLKVKTVVSSGGLNVENFSRFSDQLNKTEALALTAPNGSVERIAILDTLNESEFRRGIAATFALYYISQGKGCEVAIKDFKAKTPESKSGIQDTYDLVTNGCVVSPSGRGKAGELLDKVSVKQN